MVTSFPLLLTSVSISVYLFRCGKLSMRQWCIFQAPRSASFVANVALASILTVPRKKTTGEFQQAYVNVRPDRAQPTDFDASKAIALLSLTTFPASRDHVQFPRARGVVYFFCRGLYAQRDVPLWTRCAAVLTATCCTRFSPIPALRKYTAKRRRAAT